MHHHSAGMGQAVKFNGHRTQHRLGSPQFFCHLHLPGRGVSGKTDRSISGHAFLPAAFIIRPFPGYEVATNAKNNVEKILFTAVPFFGHPSCVAHLYCNNTDEQSQNLCLVTYIPVVERQYSNYFRYHQ